MQKQPNRNDPCWCGSGKKYKLCHNYIDEKIREFKGYGHIVPKRRLLKNDQQLAGIRDSGKRNTNLLDYITEFIQVGISTNEINRLIHEKTIALGGIPAPLGFEGYPKSICTSINNEVCHGIPSDHRILKEGDILNVDVSTLYKGYYSDSSRMFCVGEVCDQRRSLVETAKNAIEVGLSRVKPWGFLGDMGEAINDYVRSKGYSVVEEIGGHGIGLEFHEEPFVSYISKTGAEMLLVPGMVFTIEPMINMGKPNVILDETNGWTIYSADGKDSAQWEVTVGITDSGFEILAY